MKKYFLILGLFLLTIITVSAKTNSTNDVYLNSKELLTYLKENSRDKRIIKVCNQDYCDYLKYDSLEKSVKVYIDDYIEYVKEKTDDDTSVRVSLQGFLITKIYYS